MYPGVAARGCGSQGIAIIAMFGKEYFAATPIKRVQRANGSLAQSGARSPSVLPAEKIAKPIRLRKNALTSTADSVPHVPP